MLDINKKNFYYSTTIFEIPSSSLNFKCSYYIFRTSIDVHSKDTLKLIVETRFFTQNGKTVKTNATVCVHPSILD